MVNSTQGIPCDHESIIYRTGWENGGYGRFKMVTSKRMFRLKGKSTV